MKNLFIISLVLVLISHFAFAQNKFAFYKNNNLYLSSLDGEISHLGSDIKIKKDRLIETSRYCSYSLMPVDVLNNIKLSQNMIFYSALQSKDDESLWIFAEIGMQDASYNLYFFNNETKIKNLIFSQDRSPDSKYSFIPFAWTKDLIYLEARIIGGSFENEGIWTYNLITKKFSKLSISSSYLTTPIISPDRQRIVYGGTTDINKNLDSPLNIIFLFDLVTNEEDIIVKDANSWFSIIGWIENNIQNSDLISIDEDEFRLEKKNNLKASYTLPSFKFPWMSGISYCCNTGATPAPPGPRGSETKCTTENPHKYIGFDFNTPNYRDDPVLAAATGVIDFVGIDGSLTTGFGNYVRIKHDNGTITYTYYGHLKSFSVNKGDYVQQGCRIGIEGTTGESSGDHIHFECRDASYQRFTATWPIFEECGCTPHQDYLYTSNNIEVSCGITPPPNDDCSSAESLAVGTTYEGTLSGATKSLSENNCGTTSSTQIIDVWYKFVATSSSHTITATPSTGLDIVIDLRQGSCNGSNIDCKDAGGGKNKPEILTYNNFTVGNTYYIRIYQDGSFTTNEFSISVSGSTNTLQPDLIVQNAQISPSTVDIGQPVTASCIMKNRGTGNASSSVTSLWFTHDQNFDVNVDELLGEISVPALNDGETSSQLSKQINIPMGPYSLGTWYIMFGADGGTAIGESDESNNQVFVPITLQAVPQPTISVTETSLPDFGEIEVGENSSPQSYMVSGTNLTSNISIQAQNGFQISQNQNSGFTNTISLTQSGGTVSNKTIYVRFSPQNTGSFDENISHTSNGATNKYVSVSGTGMSQPSTYDLSGIVTYDNTNNSLLNDINIFLKSGTSIIGSSTSDNSGYYSINNLSNGSYTMEVNTNKPWGSVNSTDALLIRKHLVNNPAITSPIKLKAADVNNSLSISSLDALDIRKRTVGMITSFIAGDWCFEDPTIVVNNSSVNQNIKGLCVGDVNGSNTPTLAKTNPYVIHKEGHLNAFHGKIISVPVTLDRSLEISALSLFFEYPNTELEFLNINSKATDILYHTHDGIIMIAWDNLTPIKLNPGEELLIMNFELRPDFTEGILNIVEKADCEFANSDGKVIENVKLIIPQIEMTKPSAYLLTQNFPNPFNPSAKIQYSIPEEADIVISIFNSVGEEVSRLVDLKQQAGNYEVEWKADSFASGVYFYKITAIGKKDNFSQIKKMLLLK